MVKIPTISQAIGVGSLIAVGYDALNMGVKLGLDEAINEESANNADIFVNHQKSERQSLLLEKAKKTYRELMLGSGVIPIWLRVKNVFLSCGQKLIENAVPIVLAICAAKFGARGANKFKNIFGKICVAGLILFGAKTLVKDVMCIGKKKEINF